MTLIMQWPRGRCSNRRRVSNKRWVAIERRSFKVRVLIYAGGVYWKFCGNSVMIAASLHNQCVVVIILTGGVIVNII